MSSADSQGAAPAFPAGGTQREAYAFLRAILECADYSIISTAPDGTIRTFNRAAERMLGYQAEEVIGKASPEIIHDRDEVKQRALELTAELGTPVAPGFETFVAKTRLGLADEQEWTYIRKDGSRFPVQLSVTAMRDAAGQIIGFMGIAHDITRRRTAQARVGQLTAQLDRRVNERTAQLEASGQRFQLVVEASPNGIIMVDREGHMVLVNARTEQLFGYAREELLGRSVDLLVPDRVRPGHAGQRASFFAAPGARAMGAGRDLFARRKDGTDFPVEIGLNPIETAEGMMALAVVVDISARKAAERELAESEARFRGTFEQAAVGVSHVGLDGRWLLVNDWLCDLVGYTREELMARTFQDITHPDDLAPDLENVRRLLAGEIPHYGMDKRYFHKDGSLVWIRLTVSLVRAADGTPKFFISIIQDIRTRKAAEAALQQARDGLEQRVEERTAELARTNMLLFSEVEERKAIEAALRDSQARLRTIIDSTPDLIFIKDRQHRYTMVNEGYTRATGLRAEDIVGKDDLEIGFPAELVQGDPARGIRGYLADDREVMETGEMKIIPEEPGFMGGEAVFHSTVKVPLRDAAGNITGVLGYARDITERKLMEAELRHREEQLRDLFENATDLIQSVAPDGHLLFVNRAWLNTLGYRMADLATLTIFDIIHPDCLAECREQFLRVMRGEPVTGMQAIFRSVDGRKIHVEGSASCRFEDGKPVATRAIFRDISKRKAVEGERERLILELQAALAEVKTLSGLLPVCGWCKKIRDDSGYWDSVEGYLKKNSGVDITHGICPECSAKMMVELEKAVGPG